MRKQLAYNDDLSLLGQRVRPSPPRTTAATGERYRLYSPTPGGDHRQRAAATDNTFAPAKTVKTSKLPTAVKPVYAVKINNLDTVIIPVANVQLARINEAHSVPELQRLLVACTSTSAAAAARLGKPPAASSSFSTARTVGVQVYERCFLHHCTTLRDALGD